MTQYAYPNATHRGIDGLVTYVNDASGGVLMPFFLLALWGIILVVQLNYGFGRAFLSSTFVIAFLSIFLVILGFLQPMYLTLIFVMLALALLFRKLSND